MRATELRIGNIVKSTDTPDTIEVFHLDTDSDTRDRINYMGSDNFDPIPLTEEWLVKFGFEKSKSRVSYTLQIDSDNDYKLVYMQDRMLVGEPWHYNNVPCEYVHQLQNLYHALTGEEL